MPLSIDLRSYVAPGVRERGAALHGSGCVFINSADAFAVAAQVRGSRMYDVMLRREADTIFAFCDCPYFDSEGICKHIWATILSADTRQYLEGRTRSRAKTLIEDMDKFDEDASPFELRSPQGHVEPVRPPQVGRWKDQLGRLSYGLTPASPPEPWRPDRELYYVLEIGNVQWQQGIGIEALYRDKKRDGQWGKLKGTRISRYAIAQMPDEADREILAMLGGTPVTYDWSNRDSIGYGYRIEGAMAPMLLKKICATGRCRLRRERDEPLEKMLSLAWDDKGPWRLRLRLETGNGGWILRGHFVRDQQWVDVNQPDVILQEGVFLIDATFSRFEGNGAFAWSTLLRRPDLIHVPKNDGEQFLMHMLNQAELPPIDWPDELRYNESSPEPVPHLRVERPEQRRGTKDGTVCAYTAFGYDGEMVPSTASVSGVFDAKSKVLRRRDPVREHARLQELVSVGFKPAPGSYGSDAHHHLNSKKLPVAVRDLIAKGWRVDIDGRAFRKAVGHSAELTSGVDWFELRAVVDFGDAHATVPDLLKAIKQNSTFVELSDGSFGILPEDLIEQYGALLALGTPDRDHVRFKRSQTVLLDVLLAARPAVETDAVFQNARERLRTFDRIAPAEQPPGFHGVLRGYQREGLAWMRFLQDLGFGGCLADDMGLGKTAQVLALLEQRRELREAGEPLGPSLAVVPRSILFNWKQEAERFTPRLRVCEHSGTDRKKSAKEFAGDDLVLTTYGTLRRDITMLKDIEFDYVILDESQAIKNSGSDSAKSARLLQASHRLAMSGTPIENHLGELISLFEFLNPGMLGTVRGFATGGMSLRNPDEITRETLAAAVRPFLLRRTKQQVAQELPDRTEQTIYCEFDEAERNAYNELRDHYRAALLGRIEQQGIAKSKMHILEALLRLRQAACHPALLDKRREEDSSAKLEALLAQLAEVLSEGHKALVFSQFTSLLAIVRKHLDRDGTVYEYLDGRTKDRQSRVERFQNDPGCKLFLISLKAGGVGLNLTAAEYVFLLDPWWNPAVEAQAIDRAHRIGQVQHVFAYRLISKGTVEEKVLELQGHKRELAASIIRADATLVRDLKREDLEFLLS
jgi:hypothetical protein